MINSNLKQQDFAKNDISDRLLNLAKNLSQIQKLCTDKSNQESILNLIKESRYFIEWTVPEMVQINIEQAAELVDVGRILTKWLFNWEKICSDHQEKSLFSQQADKCLKIVLKISQLHLESLI